MTMFVDKPIGAIACASLGLLARIFLTLNFKESLRQRVEITTPTSDWRRAHEGIYKWNSDLDPYTGNIFHEYPISLQFYKIISNYFNVDFIFAITDICTALLLQRAVFNQMMTLDMPEEMAEAKSRKTLLIYLFSPINLMSCAGQSTALFTNFLLALICFLLPMKPFRAFTCVLCAFLACNNVHYATLILPILLCMEYCSSKRQKSSARGNSNSDKSFDQKSTGTYYSDQNFFASLWTSISICLVSIITLLVTSYLLMGNSLSFIKATYLFVFHVQDLTPNIGMFWYFFTEMFEHFLEFFTWIVQINAFIHAIPISICSRDEPFFALFITLLTSTIFQPYPNLTHIGLITSLAPQFSDLYSHMKHGLKTICTAVTAMFLWPVFWHLWINMGTANANFYFGANLAFDASLVLFMVDLLNAKIHVKAKASIDKLKREIIHP